MTTGSARVLKRVWYRLGGLRNPRCWRRQRRNGGWMYFVRID